VVRTENTRLAAAPGRQAGAWGTRGPCASRCVAYASRFRKATAPAMMAITAYPVNTAIPVHGNPPMFSPWTGFAVFTGYAVIAIIAGAVAFRKRDA
jgi:ABC-type transport system involved in multi-copper enzyme maturation permease subunit